MRCWCVMPKKAQQSELNDFLITCRQTPFGHHQRAAQRWPLSCVLCRRERWGPRLFFMFTKKIIMLIWWRERQVVASCDFINFFPLFVSLVAGHAEDFSSSIDIFGGLRDLWAYLWIHLTKKNSYNCDITTAHRLWRIVCLSHNPHTKKLSYYNVHPSTSVVSRDSCVNI